SFIAACRKLGFGTVRPLNQALNLAKNARTFMKVSMRILDRYLLRTFMMPWLSCLIGFTFLFVIVDLVESLNKFVDGGVSIFSVVAYYVPYIPSIWIYIGPITLLLALLYALYQLTRNNE